MGSVASGIVPECCGPPFFLLLCAGRWDCSPEVSGVGNNLCRQLLRHVETWLLVDRNRCEMQMVPGRGTIFTWHEEPGSGCCFSLWQGLPGRMWRPAEAQTGGVEVTAASGVLHVNIVI